MSRYVAIRLLKYNLVLYFSLSAYCSDAVSQKVLSKFSKCEKDFMLIELYLK